MREIKEKIQKKIKLMYGEISGLDKEHKKEAKEILKDFKESFSKVYEAATKDEKTGLYNHRFFKSVFEIEIERAKREKEKISLMIIDIDFFKKLNDTYGHLTGDKALIELAKTLKKVLREYDLISRFGGEEFFVLLQGESASRAKTIGDRLREKLWNNKTLKKYRLTISIGITEFKKGDNPEKIIKRADKALYISKESGRNRVSVL